MVAISAPSAQSVPSAHGQPTPARLERITVNLTQRAFQALLQAVKITGYSKTDTVNRALQLYAWAEQVADDGGTLYVRPAGKDEFQQVHFF